MYFGDVLSIRLFCALIDSTAKTHGIPNPRKNVRVSRSTSGIGKRFAGTI
jgi:hypothetical protein